MVYLCIISMTIFCLLLPSVAPLSKFNIVSDINNIYSAFLLCGYFYKIRKKCFSKYDELCKWKSSRILHNILAWSSKSGLLKMLVSRKGYIPPPSPSFVHALFMIRFEMYLKLSTWLITSDLDHVAEVVLVRFLHW